MKKGHCPICEEKIDLGNKVKFLERVCCPTCEALLEVVEMDPIVLDWIYYDEHYDSNGRERTKSPGNAQCPLCRESVHIRSSQMRIGNRVICLGCDAQLEIVSLIPLELDWPFDGGFEYYFRDNDNSEDIFDDFAN